MRIDGEWALLDDGVMRPIVDGDIKVGNDAWVKVPFLVDTGADLYGVQCGNPGKARPATYR